MSDKLIDDVAEKFFHEIEKAFQTLTFRSRHVAVAKVAKLILDEANDQVESYDDDMRHNHGDSNLPRRECNE